MKNLEKFDAIDTQFAIAVENLQRAFSEEMLNVIPFNEDNEFLFEKDGNVDYNDLPDIILGDGTRDRFAGFCKDSEGILYILVGDSYGVGYVVDDTWGADSYEPEEISIISLRDIAWFVDDWLDCRKQ